MGVKLPGAPADEMRSRRPAERRALTRLHLAVLSLDQASSACARLRVLDPVAAARGTIRLDWYAGPAEARAAFDRGALAAVDLILVQRFFPHPRNADLLERVLGGRVPVVYETDDLLTELPPTNPHAALARECAPWIERMLREARAVTVSTPELARALARAGAPEPHVLPNLVDLRLFPFHQRSGSPVTLGYSGTPTHSADLERIEPALWRAAQRLGSRVRFWFQGCITPSLARLPGATYVEMQRDYAGYARVLSGSPLDVGLAPLADHPFNRCKSAIKWLEYAACGVPGVFAALAPYQSVVRDGETGLLAGDDPDAWYEAICALALDAGLRRRIAAAARREVEARFALEGGAGAFAQTWERLALASDGRAPRVRVSIVIPVYGRVELTRQCVEALLEHTVSAEVEVIVVDNASPDATAEYLAGLDGRVRVIANAENLGFARACNQGARAARGDYLLFLNNDTIPPRGWLSPLVRELDLDPAVAIAGAKLLYADGRVQHAGIAFSRPDAVPYHVYRNAPRTHPATSRRRELRAVTGACMLVRRSAFEAAGGFDEDYRNGFEDVDLCLRVREAGGRVVYQPASELIHLEEQTPGRKAHDDANLRRFLERWGARIVPDETRVLLEDGCAARELNGLRSIAPIASIAGRRAWQRVAEAEARLESSGPDALRADPPDLALWPDDPGVQSWGRRIGGRTGASPVRRTPPAGPRLLLVAHAYPGASSGGVELYTRAFAHAMARRGAQVVILFPHVQAGLARPRLETGSDGPVRLARLAVPSPAGVLADARRESVERSFCEFVDSGRFDAVHFQHTWRALPFALLEHAAERVPAVCATLHDFWSVCRETHLVPRWKPELCSGPEARKCAECAARGGERPSSADPPVPVEMLFELRAQAVRRALARVGLVSAPSRYVIERLRAAGLDVPIALAPLGLEPIALAARTSSPALRFGHLGALCATKGTPQLLAAFAAVRGDASLLLRGPIDAAGERALAPGLRDPRVRRMGPYRREELGAVLAQLDVVVVPSLVETYSLVAREALSAGLPVVASDAGALPEVVEHERNGLLFRAGDAGALAAALQRLVDDRGLVERLRRARTSALSIDEDAAAWGERYRDLAARRAPRARRRREAGALGALA
jgi:GT2 family glycosyltransferase/glycosyltransferase involved in cell wall biosynthesis